MGTRFTVGVDLGQAQDYTAITVVERTIPPMKWTDMHKPGPIRFDVRHLERVPLGTGYPAVVQRVQRILSNLDRGTELVADATGVGRPVIDLFDEQGMRPIGVTITGGDTTNKIGCRPTGGETWRIPKRELVVGLQVLLEQGRLRIAEGLREAAIFVRELQAFQIKIDPVTGHDSYGAARERAHDDLVLAVALATWRAAYVPPIAENWNINWRSR